MSEKKTADQPIPQDVRKLIDDALPRICKRAIELIDNPHVAPSAQAQMISTLFRAAGLFNPDSGKNKKQPHEMSAAELAEELAEARSKAAALAKGKRSDEDRGILA
jgi:hypothetical protein